MAAGANLRKVQEIRGHEDITTTERYTHVSVERLYAAVARVGQRANGGIH